MFRKKKDKEKKDKREKKKSRDASDVIANDDDVDRGHTAKGTGLFGLRKTEKRKYDVEGSGSDMASVYTDWIGSDNYPPTGSKRTGSQVGLLARRYTQQIQEANSNDYRDRRAHKDGSSIYKYDAKPGLKLNQRTSSFNSTDERARVAVSGPGVPLKFLAGKHSSSGEQAEAVVVPAVMAEMGGGKPFGYQKQQPENNIFGKIDLQLPELQPVQNGSGRVLKIKRRPVGDFGFALRRSTFAGDKSKIIHLAEPVGDIHSTGLLPGDRLVEVNGVNVEHATREKIIDMIASSGDEVTLKVIPVPELMELSSRSSVLDVVNNNSSNNQIMSVSKGKPPSLARSGSMRLKRSKVS